MPKDHDLTPLAQIPDGPWLIFISSIGDELIGLGGLLLEAAERGIELTAVYLHPTIRSEGGGRDLDEHAFQEIAGTVADRLRLCRSIAAWREFTVRGGESLYLTDTVELINRVHPATIFIPSPIEYWEDCHQAAEIAWRGITGANRGPTPVIYNITNRIKANATYDISDHHQGKLALISQIGGDSAAGGSELVSALGVVAAYMNGFGQPTESLFRLNPFSLASTLEEVVIEIIRPWHSEDERHQSLRTATDTRASLNRQPVNPDIEQSEATLLRHEVARLQARINLISNSRSWRITTPLRIPGAIRQTVRRQTESSGASGGVNAGITRKLLGILREEGVAGVRRRAAAIMRNTGIPLDESVSDPHFSASYLNWIEHHETPGEEQLSAVRRWHDSLDPHPGFSIVVPTYNSNPNYLEQMVDSVVNQLCSQWELCLYDDGSTNPESIEALKRQQQRDRRIKVAFGDTNRGISAATNSAIGLSTMPYIGFLDHDDTLSPLALSYMTLEIVRSPDAALIYSDEDKIDERGTRYAPYFKPDYNPDLMRSYNMTCHFSVYRRDEIEQAGGIRSRFDGAQDYDLALRVIDHAGAGRVRHIPRILYHWRSIEGSTARATGEKPYTVDAGCRAVGDHLIRNGIDAEASPSKIHHGSVRVSYRIAEPPPLANLFIPTRNGGQTLKRCIESITDSTRYPNYRITIIDNGSDERETLAILDHFERDSEKITIQRDPSPFNYSAINNRAILNATCDVVVMMNDDIEVIDEEWLTEMVSHAIRPGIGAVGARLLYPDNRIQHAGVILGIGGVAGHAHKHLSLREEGYFGRARLIQNYSAVTAACLAIRHETYTAVGGMDEELAVAFNDIDFCLRVSDLGLLNLWTPYASLYHHESLTRGHEDTPEKVRRFQLECWRMERKWGSRLRNDPAYNPNLTLASENFAISHPRIRWPAEWRVIDRSGKPDNQGSMTSIN